MAEHTILNGRTGEKEEETIENVRKGAAVHCSMRYTAEHKSQGEKEKRV